MNKNIIGLSPKLYNFEKNPWWTFVQYYWRPLKILMFIRCFLKNLSNWFFFLKSRKCKIYNYLIIKLFKSVYFLIFELQSELTTSMSWVIKPEGLPVHVWYIFITKISRILVFLISHRASYCNRPKIKNDAKICKNISSRFQVFWKFWHILEKNG